MKRYLIAFNLIMLIFLVLSFIWTVRCCRPVNSGIVREAGADNKDTKASDIKPVRPRVPNNYERITNENPFSQDRVFIKEEKSAAEQPKPIMPPPDWDLIGVVMTPDFAKAFFQPKGRTDQLFIVRKGDKIPDNPDQILDEVTPNSARIGEKVYQLKTGKFEETRVTPFTPTTTTTAPKKGPAKNVKRPFDPRKLEEEKKRR